MSAPKKAPKKKPKIVAPTAEEQQALTIYAAKMATLAEMAGGIAHEINTPLAVILTLSSQIREMLEEGEIEKQIFIDSVRTIENTTLKIADIISGLRTFAREGSDEGLTPIRVMKLLDDTMALCRERFYNRGVQLEFIIPNPDLVVECNAGQISQVLMNLLLNCHDALLKVANRWIRIEIRDRGDNVEITITDSGEGIPEAHQKEIFRPFFTTKEVGQGPGLGLSVSRSIVESHGGTLHLDSQNPHTCFVISLPKRANPRAA